MYSHNSVQSKSYFLRLLMVTLFIMQNFNARGSTNQDQGLSNEPQAQHINTENMSGLGRFSIPEFKDGVDDATPCRIKLMTEKLGTLMVTNSAGYWKMEKVYSLGTGGRFTGRVNEVPQTRSFKGSGSRWVFIGKLSVLSGKYNVESDPNYPILFQLNKQDGLAYMCGRGVVNHPDGIIIDLGKNHNVSMMLKLAESQNPLFREGAAWALGWLPKDIEEINQSEKVLINLLNDTDEFVRITAIESLGRTGKASAIQSLKELDNKLTDLSSIIDDDVNTETKPAVRSAINSIIMRDNGLEVDGLCSVCKMMKCSVHAYESLDKLSDQSKLTKIAQNVTDRNLFKIASARITDQEVLAELILQKWADEEIRWELSALFDRLSSEESLLMIALRSQSNGWRLNAVKKLFKIKLSSTAQEKLLQLALDDEHNEVRGEIVKHIIDRQTLIKIMQEDKDSGVRQEAIKSLEKLCRSKGLSDEEAEVLKKIAESDTDKYVRSSAVELINDRQTLIKIMQQDKDYHVRWGAIRRLGELCFYNSLSKEEAEVLKKIAESDTNEYVRDSALRCLEFHSKKNYDYTK